MKKEIINQLTEDFNKYSFEEDNIEFWFARDLQKLLGYNEFRNFLKVIDKAKISCKNAKFDILNHFVETNKKVNIGSDSTRIIKDVMLTRYACYLIAQNGD